VTSVPSGGRSGQAGSASPGLAAKPDYVDRKYFGYPIANIKNGGRFTGVVLEDRRSRHATHGDPQLSGIRVEVRVY